MKTTKSHDVYIGLGSNMGDRKQNILRALEMLWTTKQIKVDQLSTICETLPIGIREQDPFLNAILKIRTLLSPIDLHKALTEIESRLGRVRLRRWGPRVIDLDILYYGNETVDLPDLKVPHPEIVNRPFVLNSLRELNCPCGPGFHRGDGHNGKDHRPNHPRHEAPAPEDCGADQLRLYDHAAFNEAGVDVILVGDSLGMVKLGYDSTLPVTVEDMAYHTRIVARGKPARADCDGYAYLSYQASTAEAVRYAGWMLKAGAHAVKIEGGTEMVPVVRALLSAKIPVMGHIGMTPQSVNLFGGYKVQGRQRAQEKKMITDARALEKAGAFSLVVECVPAALGRRLSRALRIPTIGIGAGPGCDGQVLVIDDLLGLTAPPSPRFVKRYADLRRTITSAARDYARDVRSGRFPDDGHSYL